MLIAFKFGFNAVTRIQKSCYATYGL
jgi:hypothetical protein